MPDLLSPLAQDFQDAAARSKQLSERPDNLTLLRLYALFKQGSEGDVQGERPGLTDFVGRAKWDAWKALAGTPQDEAQRCYIDLVDSLA